MSLDGLRAWIAEVERKLRMRTRVFLVLTVIAIGLGAAGIYLAIDARDNSVSKDDVRELQQQLEAQIDEAATGAPSSSLPPAEEAESAAPEAEPEAKAGKGKNSGATEPGDSSGGIPNSATGGAASATELQELVEKAKKRQAEAE
jgi:type II secretory pathway pseudopilin PulG